jgi:hypothetical protein
MLIILAIKRERQEDHEFKAYVIYTVRLCPYPSTP